MPGPVVAEHGHAIVVGGGDQDTRAHVTLEMKYKDGGCIVDNFPFFWLFLFWIQCTGCWWQWALCDVETQSRRWDVSNRWARMGCIQRSYIFVSGTACDVKRPRCKNFLAKCKNYQSLSNLEDETFARRGSTNGLHQHWRQHASLNNRHSGRGWICIHDTSLMILDEYIDQGGSNTDCPVGHLSWMQIQQLQLPCTK